MRRSARLATIVLVVAAATVAGGCSTAVMSAAGLSAHIYRTNTTLEVIFDANYREVVSATASALGELDIVVESRGIDLLEGEVAGRTATGQSVNVKAIREAGNNSSVSIRVGILGDEALNWAIYRAIRRRLDESASARLTRRRALASK